MKTNKETAELRPIVEFENWAEAFECVYDIICLCESTSTHLGLFSPDNKNDWEKSEIMGANELNVSNGLRLVKKILPILDIEKVLKQ